MSLFVTSLAFGASDTLENARSAVLLGSVLSAVAGLLLLRFAGSRQMGETHRLEAK